MKLYNNEFNRVGVGVGDRINIEISYHIIIYYIVVFNRMDSTVGSLKE